MNNNEGVFCGEAIKVDQNIREICLEALSNLLYNMVITCCVFCSFTCAMLVTM